MQEYKVKIEENEINLKVIYEDNHIIVVEKPANIPSQGDKTGDLDMLTIIKAYLKEKYNKPGNVYLGLVHRLDRPVGGVMVFAKTSKAAARLSEQVREKVFKKKYLVIVNGKFEEKKGTLKDYLLKNERLNKSRVVEEGTKNSKLAKLDYEVIKRIDYNRSLRDENKIKLIIRTELETLEKNKEYTKLKYLYMEWFNKEPSDGENMYKVMNEKLSDEIGIKEKRIYDLIKLSYNKV